MDYLAPIRTQDTIFRLNKGKMDQANLLAKKTDPEKTAKELTVLSRQFESIFIHQLLQSARNTVPKTGLFSSFAKDMWESMLDQELASEMSKEKGIGLADMVYRDLSSKVNGSRIKSNKSLKDYMNIPPPSTGIPLKREGAPMMPLKKPVAAQFGIPLKKEIR